MKKRYTKIIHREGVRAVAIFPASLGSTDASGIEPESTPMVHGRSCEDLLCLKTSIEAREKREQSGSQRLERESIARKTFVLGERTLGEITWSPNGQQVADFSQHSYEGKRPEQGWGESDMPRKTFSERTKRGNPMLFELQSLN